MHIGILTGGGDCPGLNAVIRAVTLALVNEAGARVTGIRRGFLGLITREVQALDADAVAGILAEGGTILGTHNRCDPFHYFGAQGADVSAQVLAYARELGLDGLVAIGGDGTMAIAHRFEVRATLLGHLQRGGTPTVFDRVLSTRFGYAAAQLVRQGQWGAMVALQGAQIVPVDLALVAGRNRLVPSGHELLAAARGLGVCLGEA